ncbi:MAG: hemK [Frankiales bacterium]|nr:hemK [Frankiales bacterium]
MNVREAARVLTAAGVASPDHDARALAAYVLGCRLLEVPLREADLDEERYDDLVARRAQRVPLQHLVGSVAFRWTEVLVGPGVFVPRPETESVVEWALPHLTAGSVVVDLCTGSGAIAKSIAAEVPGIVVHAVDKDAAAVEWARRNLAGTGVVVHHCSAAEALPGLDAQVDLVISNPPYVPVSSAARMEPEVLDHDPHVALFADDDGLAVVREVEQAARRLLRPGGLIVVEHDDSQGSSAPAVFADWAEVADHDDLTGRPRFVTARWSR